MELYATCAICPFLVYASHAPESVLSSDLVYPATSLGSFSFKAEPNKTLFQKPNHQTPSIHRKQDTLPLPPPGTGSCDLTCDTSARPHFFISESVHSGLLLSDFSRCRHPNRHPFSFFYLSRLSLPSPVGAGLLDGYSD